MKKTKKILFVAFLMIMFFILSGIDGFTVQAASKGKYFKSGELYYHTISKNKVEVCGTSRDEGTLTIPSSVYYKGKKYTVTRIADYEIYYQDNPITEETTDGYSVDVNMPGYKYYRYDRVDGKEMPTNVNWIPGCGITEVVLPSTLTYIGEGAFCGCDKLKSVVFAKSYKKLTIGKNAFSGTSLKSIRFPKGTYELKDGATGEVATIYIPKTVKKIGAGVVNYKTKKVIIDKKNKKFKMKGGILYSYNEKTLIGASAKVPSKVKVSSKTTKITKYAFAGSKVTKVTLNSKIKTIPKGAFYKCSKLTEVKKTEGVTKIDYAAFAVCKKLESVGNLPKVTDIGRAAFWCDKKLNIHLSAKIVNVDEYAFAGSKYSVAMNVTVDENNQVYSVKDGFLVKTEEAEKVLMLQLKDVTEIATIPEGITNVAVMVGGSKCKKIIFPESLREQNGIASVNNGTIVYQSLAIPKFGEDFGLVNEGNDVLTVIVPKGMLQSYKDIIDGIEMDKNDVEFFMDGINEIKEQ